MFGVFEEALKVVIVGAAALLRLSVAPVPCTNCPAPATVPAIVAVPLFVNVPDAFTVTAVAIVAVPLFVSVPLLFTVVVGETRFELFTSVPAPLTVIVVTVRVGEFVAEFVSVTAAPTVVVVAVIERVRVTPLTLLKFTIANVSRFVLDPPIEVAAGTAGVSKFSVLVPAVTGVAALESFTKLPVKEWVNVPAVNVAVPVSVNTPLTVIAAAGVFAPEPENTRWL